MSRGGIEGGGGDPFALSLVCFTFLLLSAVEKEEEEQRCIWNAKVQIHSSPNKKKTVTGGGGATNALPGVSGKWERRARLFLKGTVADA